MYKLITYHLCVYNSVHKYLLTYRKSNLCLFSIFKKGNLKDVSLNNQLVGQPINFKDLGKNEKSRSSPSCNTSASPLYRNLNNEKKKILIMFTFTQMFDNNFISFMADRTQSRLSSISKCHNE